MNIKFKPSEVIIDVKNHYCPGCTHGIINNIIGEVLEELNILKNLLELLLLDVQFLCMII